MDLAISATPSTTSSKRLWWTYSREPATQHCPWLKKIALAAPSIAPSTARAELAKPVTHITLQPQYDHYVATGEWNLLGKQPILCDGEGMRVWMVAGGGFEPPTFGL